MIDLGEMRTVVVWTIPDHPWTDGSDAAAVRVAMTVLASGASSAIRYDVDDTGAVVGTHRVRRLNADLSVGVDLTNLSPLQGMRGLCVPGMQIDGAGFMLDASEAAAVLAGDPRNHEVVKPYLNGRDLMASPRGLSVIDFGLLTEEQAREYASPFDIVRARVLPQRQSSGRASYRTYWWRFAEPRRTLREALVGLSRYIATTRTARRRVFRFLPAETVPDSKIVCVASDSSYVLGVLSSSIHVEWAAAAGGRLGFGNDASYDKARCFDPFPFPDASIAQQGRIARLAERIEAHREKVVGQTADLTVTNIYAVLEKLSDSSVLTPKERAIYEGAACGVLRDLHQELDAAVAEAYGWSWPEPPALILERLVALHDRRVEEEAAGTVRWLRPDYQIPRFGRADEMAAAAPTLDLPAETSVAKPSAAPAAATRWPADAIGQITVLHAMAAMTPVSIEEAVQRLVGAKRDIVGRHLETLAMLGEVRDVGGGRYAVAAGGV